jgi:hypothetical protein
MCCIWAITILRVSKKKLIKKIAKNNLDTSVRRPNAYLVVEVFWQLENFLILFFTI